MNPNDEHFIPDVVDEQIDMFVSNTPEPDARLLTALHAVHQEDVQLANRVWQRLKQQVVERENAVYTAKKRQLRFPTMQAPQIQNTKSRAYGFTMVTATLVATLLFGSLLLVSSALHNRVGTNTTNISTSQHSTPTSIYLNGRKSIMRVDAGSGKTLWQYTLTVDTSAPPEFQKLFVGQPYLANGIVYAGSQNGKLYALNAETGNVLWIHTFYKYIADPFRVGNTLYVTVIDPNATITGGDGVSLYTFDATSGAERAHVQITVQHGDQYLQTVFVKDTLYVASYSDLYAFNIATGTQKWHTQVNSEQTLFYVTPQVIHGVLYTVSASKKYGQPVTDYTSYLYAFDTNTGTRLWQSAQLPGLEIMSPLVIGNALYIGADNHVVYALNASNGAFLWHRNIGKAIAGWTLVADGPTLYCASSDVSSSSDMLALKISDGTVIWKKSFSEQSTESVDSLVLHQGIIYIRTSTTLFALHASNGTIVWQKLLNKLPTYI